MKNKYKIGDWLYIEKTENDFRDFKYIPVFQVKDFDGSNTWVRPVKGLPTGVEICENIRYATPEEIAQYKKDNGIVDEVKFEVGCWYNFNNPDYKGNTYAKFKRLSDCKKYFYFTEYIGDNKHGIYNSNWDSKRCRSKLTDLSEIQQYLPSGHPDLLPKEEAMKTNELTSLPEKWYIEITKDNLTSINKVRNKQLRMNSSLRLDDFNYIANSLEGYIIQGHTYEPENYIKITFDQFKKWVLKEPINESTIPEPKFKIGDTIQINKGGWQYTKSGLETISAISFMKSDQNVKSGKCTDIIYSNKNKIHFYQINNFGNYFTEDCIILVENNDRIVNDIPEYVECIKEVGYTIVNKIYKCRIKNNKFEWYYDSFNTSSKSTLNVWDNVSGWEIDQWKKYFKPSTKEAYDIQNKPKVHNLLDAEVGDTVRYIENNNSKYSIGGGLGWSKDYEFIIDKIDKYPSSRHNVYFPKKGSGVFSEFVELVKKGKSKEELNKEELLAEAKRRYPIGTKFKCANNNPKDLHGCIVKDHNDFELTTLYGKRSIHHGNNWIFMGDKNQWAEIVSLPKNKSDSYPTDVVYQPGDKVRVLRKVATRSNGWDNSWSFKMDDAVGKICTVFEDCRANGVTINEFGGYAFPHFVLEKVSESETDSNEITPIVGRWYNIEAFGGVTYQVQYNTNWYNCKYISSGTYGGSKGAFSNVKIIREIDVPNLMYDQLGSKLHEKYFESIVNPHKGDTNLISYDDEPMVLDVPKKVNSISTKFLVLED